VSAIRVVHGDPDDGELAALVAVLQAARVAREPATPGPSVWGDPAWRAREPRAAVEAWRMSGLPH
jgi:hypothetical protein